MGQDKRLTGYARDNRQNLTRAEFVLWQELRGSRLGPRFRRQDPIGPYIADFCCRKRRLVIEIDGDSHTSENRDRSRDWWFARHGWLVVRFDNEDILEHLDETVALIAQAVHDSDSITDPWNTGSTQ